MFLIILGNMGAADDIYGDEFYVYDSGEGELPPSNVNNSFDIDSIRYTPNVREPEFNVNVDGLESDRILTEDSINVSEGTVYSWDGTESDGDVSLGEGEFPDDNLFGYVVWDVSHRSDEFYFDVTDAENVDVRIRDDVCGEREIRVLSGESENTYVLDFSGEDYLDAETGEECDNIEDFQLVFESEDASADVGGGNFAEETSIFNFFQPLEVFARYFQSASSSAVEVARMMIGYVEFAASVPGLVGSFLRFYMGILVPVIILKELWFG